MQRDTAAEFFIGIFFSSQKQVPSVFIFYSTESRDLYIYITYNYNFKTPKQSSLIKSAKSQEIYKYDLGIPFAL